MAKNRGIVFLHKTKDEIIKLLEQYDVNKQNNVNNDNEEQLLDYEKMNSRQLKELAKNRGFTKYNNMNNTNLRILLKEYDEAIEKKKQEEEKNNKNIEYPTEFETKEFKLVHENGNTFPILIREDGMVNATMLCKAMGKVFYEYERSKQAREFIEALKSETEFFRDELIVTKKGGDPKLQGSWVNRLLAIDVCRWGCPRFAVQITKFIDELMIIGKIEL